MAGARVAERFAQRQREKRSRALRYTVRLLLVSVVVLVCTVVPMLLQWWDTAVPAAIGTAIVALLLFSILVSLPLEFVFSYIWPYFEGDPNRIPHPGPRFGRALFRESARLDEWAREAGLPPLTDFESSDVTETGEPPRWHAPDALLPTVDQLLSRAESGSDLERELRQLQQVLGVARQQGARCYLMLLTWGGGTNAMVEARRRGEPV